MMSKNERLWSRYWGIRERHQSGYAVPILWHLAMRKDAIAMTELADTFDNVGRICEPFSPDGLAYRAYRNGYALGAQHLAMNAFNRYDLTGYRHWLARAARAGDEEALRELRRFETRLPHKNAALIGRKRPYRPYDLA